MKPILVVTAMLSRRLPLRKSKAAISRMKATMLIVLALAGCADSRDGTVPSFRAIAPSSATVWLPATAGALVTDCQYTDDGFTCPQEPSALMGQVAWRATRDGAQIVFPLPLRAGDHALSARGIVTCDVGSVVTVSVFAEDPNLAQGYSEGQTAVPCAGDASQAGEIQFVEPPELDPNGYRHHVLTVRVNHVVGTVLIRGVDVTLHHPS